MWACRERFGGEESLKKRIFEIFYENGFRKIIGDLGMRRENLEKVGKNFSSKLSLAVSRSSVSPQFFCLRCS